MLILAVPGYKTLSWDPKIISIEHSIICLMEYALVRKHLFWKKLSPQTQNPTTRSASRCCVAARSIANQASLYYYVVNSPAVGIKSIKKIQKSSRRIGNQYRRVRRYRKISLLPQKSDSDAPYKRGCSAEIVAKTDNFCPKPLQKIIGCDLWNVNCPIDFRYGQSRFRPYWRSSFV